jgi:hypothetical protein
MAMLTLVPVFFKCDDVSTLLSKLQVLWSSSQLLQGVELQRWWVGIYVLGTYFDFSIAYFKDILQMLGGCDETSRAPRLSE